VEEAIIQRAKEKLLLEHVVVQKLDQGVDQTELNKILSYGTKQFFQDEDNDDGGTLSNTYSLLFSSSI
jgi:hypothetical protein